MRIIFLLCAVLLTNCVTKSNLQQTPLGRAGIHKQRPEPLSDASEDSDSEQELLGSVKDSLVKMQFKRDSILSFNFHSGQAVSVPLFHPKTKKRLAMLSTHKVTGDFKVIKEGKHKFIELTGREILAYYDFKLQKPTRKIFLNRVNMEAKRKKLDPYRLEDLKHGESYQLPVTQKIEFLLHMVEKNEIKYIGLHPDHFAYSSEEQRKTHIEMLIKLESEYKNKYSIPADWPFYDEFRPHVDL